jgi:hypothetical protein
MDNPTSDGANVEAKILFDNNVLFENKIFGANAVAGSSYIVVVAFPTASLTPQQPNDSDYSDYNFLSNYGGLSLDDAYQAFMSLNEGIIGDGFAITEIDDGAEIEMRNFNSVDDLAQPVKHEAIRLARDILEKLKIKFGEQNLDGLMKDDDKAPLKKLLNGVDKVEITFLHHLNNAKKIAPELLEDDEVIKAGNAFGVFKYQGKKLQIKDLEEELVQAKAAGNQELVQAITSAIQKLKVEVATTPDEYKAGGDRPVKELLHQIEVGLERLAHKMQEMTQAGLSTVQSSRDLGAQEMDQQSKTTIIDVGKSQADMSKQQERLHQTVNMQKINENMRNEKANSIAAQAQQAETQKSKEAQSARQERQEARQQRTERQQRREARQQQQAQSQQSSQQRQEARQQRQQEVQQRLEARQQRREARAQQAQNQVNANANAATIEENLRRMRREQRKAVEAQTKVQQQAATIEAQVPQAKPQKPNNPNKVNNNEMMKSLLASNIGGMQSLQSMQNMEVPDALKPNSAARMVKAITQQREANIEVSNVTSTPTVATTDLPILIKPNNQLGR